MHADRDVLIASSQFPSGVAWLLNCLLELDVVVYRQSLGHTWIFDPSSRTYSLRPDEAVLQQWIPALSARTAFRAREDVHAEWSHAFPHAETTERKVVLLVRDGRDAVYSQYRREEACWTALAEMLASPGPPLGLPPAETWALHALLWARSIPRDRLHVVRFEDLKREPFAHVERLLGFLGITGGALEIERAIAGSSFERARAAEDEYRRSGRRTEFGLVNRRGVPGEWHETFDADDAACFAGLASEVLADLGYVAADASVPATRTGGRPQQRDSLPAGASPGSRTWARIARAQWSGQYRAVVGTPPPALAATLAAAFDRVFVKPSVVLGFFETLCARGERHGMRAALRDLAADRTFGERRDDLRRLGILLGRAGCPLAMRRALRLADGDAWRETAWRGMAQHVFAAASPAVWGERVRRALRRRRDTAPVRSMLAARDWLRRRRGPWLLVRPPLPRRDDGQVFLHLGCGDQHAPGWTNVDVARLPHIHFRHDVRVLREFADQSVDVVYACHVLEHFAVRDVPDVLREWLRVLKPDGRLRVSVPDFGRIVAIYRHEGAIGAILPALMGGQRDRHDFHRSAFDAESLEALLTQAGFERVAPFDPATPPTDVFSDWARLPISTSGGRSCLVSLNLEAFAPRRAARPVAGATRELGPAKR